MASLFQSNVLIRENLWKYFCYNLLLKNISYISLVFLVSIVVFGNFKEKSFAASYLDEKFYNPDEVEGFVTSVSAYTPILEEEPSLVAEAITLNGSAVETQEFLDKPVLAATLPSDIQPEPQQEQRRGIITYTVLGGDTLSGIAGKFGISTKTIADANNLSSVNSIKPGQTLQIPPVDGVIYTVLKGDTISGIVKKLSGNLMETLKYNPETIQPGQKIVVVGGTSPVLLASRTVVARSSSSGRTLGAGGNRSNGYPWGWCTWYAAYRRRIPQHWGNAGRWLTSARASGYATGSTPRPGAIIVTRESWWGHVGYVEAVNGSSVTISEMNFVGFGVISSRTISSGDSVIRGYIY